MKREPLPAPDYSRDDLVGGIFPRDPVIEFYKRSVNREELRANLALTVEQRMEKLCAMIEDIWAARRARKAELEERGWMEL